MIAIDAETVLSLSAAAKSLPGRPHISTVWRWAHRGVRGVKLETLCIGGTRYTSREALQRFANRLTGGDAAPSTTPAPAGPRTPRQRAKAIAAAERELDRAGI